MSDNQQPDDNDPDLLIAEYVLGVLPREQHLQLQARAAAVDELLASGALDDPTGLAKDDLTRELDALASDAQVDNELAALKASLPGAEPQGELPAGTFEQPPAPGVCRLMLDPRAALSLRDLPRPPDGRVELLIGAEGGLAPEEMEWAAQAGFGGVRLGPRVLRTETAGLAVLAALQSLWGDF
mgnify:CR=1 FL=1